MKEKAFIGSSIRMKIKHTKTQTHNFGCDREKVFYLNCFFLSFSGKVNLKIINEFLLDEV